MKSIFNQLYEIENSENFHIARLLLIINSMASFNNGAAIKGITKLAKLDFLLRYPVVLEKALEAKGVNAARAIVHKEDRDSIESKMIRYRFGPWDFRYRRFLDILRSKSLVHIETSGRTIEIRITKKGSSLAEVIALHEAYQDINKRVSLLKYFDMTATNLMKFIYDTFPELASLKLGDKIHI